MQGEFNGLPIDKFRLALIGELGFVVEACYQPLHDCTLYRPQTKKRYRISEEHWRAIDAGRFSLPVCEKIYTEESVVFHHKILMGAKADMDQIAEAIRKVHDSPDEYARIEMPA